MCEKCEGDVPLHMKSEVRSILGVSVRSELRLGHINLSVISLLAFVNSRFLWCICIWWTFHR